MDCESHCFYSNANFTQLILNAHSKVVLKDYGNLLEFKKKTKKQTKKF